jgi:outer membrane protein assembly factor BamB
VDRGKVWLGFSNWEHGHWDWRRAPEGDVLNLGGAGYSPYTTASAGHMLVAVVMLGQDPCALAALSIGETAAGPWRMSGHDAQHTRRSELAGPDNGALRWQFRSSGAGFGFSSAAQGADGTLYVSSGDSLHAIKPDGAQLWVSEPTGGEFSDLALGNDGEIVAGCADGFVRAYGGL